MTPIWWWVTTDRTKCVSHYIRYRLGSQHGAWHWSSVAVTIFHGHRVDLVCWSCDDLSWSSGGFAILSMEIGIRLYVRYYGVVIFGRMCTPKSQYPSSGRSLVHQRQFSFWQHVKFRFWQLLVVWISALCLLHVILIWCSTLCFFSGRSYFWILVFWFDFCWQETGLICWLLPVTQRIVAVGCLERQGEWWVLRLVFLKFSTW